MFIYFDSLGCIEYTVFEKDGNTYIQKSTNNPVFPSKPFLVSDTSHLRDSEEAAYAVWVANQLKLQKDSVLESQKHLELEKQKLKDLIKKSHQLMENFPEEFI